MKIIIEVFGGCVTGVYSNLPQGVDCAFIVDLDGAGIGEETTATTIEVEPLDKASDVVLEALPKHDFHHWDKEGG